MEVIIGGRQSGKTTKLVDATSEYLTDNPHDTVVIVAPSTGMRRHIRREITKRCGFCEHRVISSHKMLTGFKGKHFVDEFMFLGDEELFIDENTYYTGSLREDFDNIGFYGKELVNYAITHKNDILKRYKLKKHRING